MIYKHKQFILNTDNKKVFDENKKELRLTGNAYRMLEFLCKNKNANITEIGDFFDWAKDYNENHIRQYRYKINIIIGNDVVEYKNGVYSLVGDIKELDRNTDLLQEDDVKLEKSNKSIMEKLENIKFTIIPAIIASAILFLALLELPYGYYTFLRVVVSIISIYYAYWIYEEIKKQGFWFWGLIATIILFNPIIPIHLGDKSIWAIIDIIAGLFFISLIIKYKKNKNK